MSLSFRTSEDGWGTGLGCTGIVGTGLEPLAQGSACLAMTFTSRTSGKRIVASLSARIDGLRCQKLVEDPG